MDMHGKEQTMRIQLSDHFTYKRLLRFTASPVLMMVCISLYSIVDGFFVSNFVGKTPFAAVNLVMPVTMAVGTVGFMIGAGGNAVISITLGEKKKELANQYFSMLVYASSFLSVLLSCIGVVLMPQIADALGADGELRGYCIVYGRILFASQLPFVLQNVFQQFLIAAEKPELSLKISVLAGVTNMVLDFFFIVVFRWGIAGAALATALGQVAGSLIPLIYFLRENDSLLRLTKAPFRPRIFAVTCANGSSEMVSNLSTSVINILYNFQLMRLAGENGIAAYGIIMYVNFIFMAIFIGYASGSAPVVSFHYGANNRDELKNLYRKSLILMGGTGIVMTILAELAAGPLVKIFAGYDETLYLMTRRGFRLYSLSFFMMGINVWGSSFFTALNNGAISAAISFLRTFLFQTAAVLALPLWIGIDGIWLAIVVAELFTVFITAFFLAGKRKDYHYG